MVQRRNMQKFIKQTIDGEEVFIDNPDYRKKLQKEKYQLFLKKSNIPSFYWDIEFKNYHGNKESEEFKKVVYYAEHCHENIFDHVSLYLYGGQGTQKTALVSNVGKQAIKNGLRVKFILAGDLIDLLMKNSGYNNEDGISENIKDFKEHDLIILDDFADLEKSIIWQNNKSLIITEWDRFLRHTISNGVKFVITSNYDPATVEKTFNKSLHDLIERNFVVLYFSDSVKEVRKLNVKNAFKGME
jgi:DNA replication protein DnaC